MKYIFQQQKKELSSRKRPSVELEAVGKTLTSFCGFPFPHPPVATSEKSEERERGKKYLLVLFLI
jgi:hypothetical protein